MGASLLTLSYRPLASPQLTRSSVLQILELNFLQEFLFPFLSKSTCVHILIHNNNNNNTTTTTVTRNGGKEVRFQIPPVLLPLHGCCRKESLQAKHKQENSKFFSTLSSQSRKATSKLCKSPRRTTSRHQRMR